MPHKLVATHTLVPHRKNPNVHPKEQVERLADLIKAHGFRVPIIVSNLSGQIVAGHGRLLAAKKLGLKEVPVDYQDFDDEAAEYAFLVSDNAIAGWSDLDLSSINEDIAELGPDFDLDLLGLKDFTVDASERVEQDEKKDDRIKCPECGQTLK